MRIRYIRLQNCAAPFSRRGGGGDDEGWGPSGSPAPPIPILLSDGNVGGEIAPERFRYLRRAGDRKGPCLFLPTANDAVASSFAQAVGKEDPTSSTTPAPTTTGMPLRTFFALCLLLCSIVFTACTDNSTSTKTANGHQTTSFTSSSGGNQAITYDSGPQDVLIRTFYGGGLYGSLEFSPNLSIYGDGTYILGTDRKGKLSNEELQQLLHTLVDTYGLLSMQRQQFVDVQDQNATFLEIALDGKQKEYIYGSFGNVQESQQDMAEYHRLNNALTTINDALKGSTHLYRSKYVALLARQTFTPDLSQNIANWPLSDYTLAQAAVFVCGVVPQDDTSPNAETGCLKYLKPQNAILLTATQLQALIKVLNGQQAGTLYEAGLYYIVFLRPLLPDELSKKAVAMFGSDQFSYSAVPLLEGTVPPVPTPTPSR